MTDEATYPGPFTQDLIRGNHGLLKQRDLATVVSRPGDDVRDTSNRVRGYVAKGYLHPRGQDADDKRGSFLFDDAAALTAAAFQSVTASGMSSAAAMRAVELAFQAWSDERMAEIGAREDVRNPADLMLKAWRDDGTRAWTLRVQFRRHAVSGGQEVRAGFFADGQEFGPPLEPREGYGIESELVVPLDDLISRVADATARLREAR